MRKYLTLIIYIVFSTFSLMLLFEAIKEYFFSGTLTHWESHWITVTFTTIIVFIITLLSVKRLLNLQQQNLLINLKTEKIKSIRQVMKVVHHNVNNMANNLLLVQLEIAKKGSVSPETLDSLNQEIRNTAKTMKKLGEIEDPNEEDQFKL